MRTIKATVTTTTATVIFKDANGMHEDEITLTGKVSESRVASAVKKQYNVKQVIVSEIKHDKKRYEVDADKFLAIATEVGEESEETEE